MHGWLACWVSRRSELIGNCPELSKLLRQGGRRFAPLVMKAISSQLNRGLTEACQAKANHRSHDFVRVQSELQCPPAGNAHLDSRLDGQHPPEEVCPAGPSVGGNSARIEKAMTSIRGALAKSYAKSRRSNGCLSPETHAPLDPSTEVLPAWVECALARIRNVLWATATEVDGSEPDDFVIYQKDCLQMDHWAFDIEGGYYE